MNISIRNAVNIQKKLVSLYSDQLRIGIKKWRNRYDYKRAKGKN